MPKDAIFTASLGRIADKNIYRMGAAPLNVSPLTIAIATHLFALFTFLLTLVFVAVLLRSRKSPTSTIAWLGIVILIPYIGVPLFLVFGVRKIHARMQHLSEFDFDRFQEIKSNTEIKFLTTGEEAFSSLLHGIQNSRSSIDLSVFIFRKDKSGLRVLQELTTKAFQGVRVRLLLDAFGSSILVRPPLKAFRAAGGRVAFFMPLLHIPFHGQTNLRNHRKMALFDRRSTWFGGMNIAEEYLGDAPMDAHWTDLAVSLTGDSIGDFQNVFDSDWAFAAHEPFPSPRAENNVASKPGQDSYAQVIASGPDTSLDRIYEVLLTKCFEARSRIWIATPYFIPDESLIKALELAARRGVDVRVVIPEKSNHFFADLSRTTYLRQLLEAGGKVFFYPRMMHAKLVSFDDHFCMVGSANFDLRSLHYSYEIGVALTSAKELEAAHAFQQKLFSQSHTRMPESSLFRDLIEGLGRIFGPLL